MELRLPAPCFGRVKVDVSIRVETGAESSVELLVGPASPPLESAESVVPSASVETPY